MECPPNPDPEAEARAREEILSIQQEICTLFESGVATKRFDDKVDAVKRTLREGAFSKAIEEAFIVSIELEAFRKDHAACSALLSELRAAISKASGLGLDTQQAAAHLATADTLLRQGDLEGFRGLIVPDLQQLQETLWTSDAVRDAILQAQQVLVRLYQAGAKTSAGERSLDRAREAVRAGRFDKALALAHKANPDKANIQLEKQEALKLLTTFEGLISKARGMGLSTDNATLTLRRARHDLERDLSATAAHVAKAGIEDLEKRVRSFDHATGLRRKVKALYGEIASEAGRDTTTEGWIRRTEDFLAASRFEEAQLLATRLVERMAKYKGIIAEYNACRTVIDRYLRSLHHLGIESTQEIEQVMLRSLVLHQSWDFQDGLDSLEQTQMLLLDLLATDGNLDRLEARIDTLLRAITNEGIRKDLANRVKMGRELRNRDMRQDAYQLLEEGHFLAESSLGGREGAAPEAVVVSTVTGPVPGVTVPPDREGEGVLRSPLDPSRAVSAPPPGSFPLPGDLDASCGATGLPFEDEGEALAEQEPPMLQRLRMLSNDRLLVGLDTAEMDGIVEDVRRLWDADDASSAEVLVEFASRTSAPSGMPFTHGVEVELGLVYEDGSWVTGARVSEVVEDVVEGSIKRLRDLVEHGQVPSYVTERVVDMRITEPDKPKRGKVVQVDYLLDGKLTTTEVIGRDAHGIGTTYILELVTPPCRFVEELLWWLGGLQRVCCEVLEEKHADVRLISVGLNPAQPYSEGISFGDHHHIGLPDEAMRRAAYNMLRAHVPHLIALTANSPIFKGVVPPFRCDGDHPVQFMSRTDPLSIRLRQNIGQLGPVGSNYIPYLREGDGPDEFTAAVKKASATDARLVDIYPFTRFGTIEIRFFDAQLSILDRVAMALILQALCRWGVRWAMGGKGGPDVGQQVLLENRDRALQMGMLLGFLRDKDLHSKSNEFAVMYQGRPSDPVKKVKRLHDAVERMFENIWEDLETIVPGGPRGGMLDTYLTMVHGGTNQILVPPITPGQFLLYQQASPERGIPGLIRYLDGQSRECGRNLRHNPVTDVLGSPAVPSTSAPTGQEPSPEAPALRLPSAQDVAVATGAGDGSPEVVDKPHGTRPAARDGDLVVEDAPLDGSLGAAPPSREGGPEHGLDAGAPAGPTGVRDKSEGATTRSDRSQVREEGETTCPSCGEVIKVRFRFCPACGTQIPGTNPVVHEEESG